MTETVGVVPATALRNAPRLLKALSQAFPVRFEPREPGQWRDLDAAILIGVSDEVASEALTAGVANLFHCSSDGPISAPAEGEVVFSDHRRLPQSLRGRALRDLRGGNTPVLTLGNGGEALATCDGAPVWAVRSSERGAIHLISTPLCELGSTEVLRHRLQGGDFLSLLPLIQFLREVTVDPNEIRPPLRAAFIFDDPNLHLTTYGHVRYRDLIRHGDDHNHHVAFATIPLDSWWVNGAAARLFRENPHRLSLLIHGNNHTHHELAQPLTENAIHRNLAQALRRIARLERRGGIPVSRVMVAPHGVCAEATAHGMMLLGYEAMCQSRSRSWLPSPPPECPLAHWEMAEFIAGGFPVIPRYSLAADREDLPLRAFLGQPLILYGHHGDLAKGLDGLEEAAKLVNSLGSVRWMSPGEIAQSNFTARHSGQRLRVRLFSRRALIEIPSDVTEIAVEKSGQTDEHDGEIVRIGDRTLGLSSGEIGQYIPLASDAPRHLEISLLHPASIDSTSIPSPLPHPFPIARRVMTETRDRLKPLLSKLRG